MSKDQEQIGARIKRLRLDADLSLSELADNAGISKSYLWKLESGGSEARPSGRTLYRIAKALGTSMSELLGREVLVDEPDDLPASLVKFAQQEELKPRDIRMLARINFRGRQPATAGDWAFLWDALQRSVPPRTPRASSVKKPAKKSSNA